MPRPVPGRARTAPGMSDSNALLAGEVQFLLLEIVSFEQMHLAGHGQIQSSRLISGR